MPRLPPKSNRTFGCAPWPPCPVFIVIRTLIDLIIVSHCSATFTFIGCALSLKCSLGTRRQTDRTLNSATAEFVTCRDSATWVVLKLFGTTIIVRASRGSHTVIGMRRFMLSHLNTAKLNGEVKNTAKNPAGLWRQPRHVRSRDLELVLDTALARNLAVAIPPTVCPPI